MNRKSNSEISKPSISSQSKDWLYTLFICYAFPRKKSVKKDTPTKSQIHLIVDKYKKIHIGTAKVKDMNENTIRIHPPVMFYRSPSYKKGYRNHCY